MLANAPTGGRLDRAAWHRPLMSVIITHHNYSHLIGDALASLLDQTHDNWECVVVDDASLPEHRSRLETIVEQIGDGRIRLACLTQNLGQIPAFFAGLEQTSGEFVCLLDPDDRYAATFLEETLAAHLNETVICPVVSTDQYLLKEGEVIASVITRHRARMLERIGPKALKLNDGPSSILFFPRQISGWLWATTSSLIYRRAALAYLKPHRPLRSKGGADVYLAVGTHVLGGTLFLTKPLVYRSLHADNLWIRRDIYASGQKHNRDGAVNDGPDLRRDLVEVLRYNSAPVSDNLLRDVVLNEKRLLSGWRRSLQKRLPWRAK